MELDRFIHEVLVRVGMSGAEARAEAAGQAPTATAKALAQAARVRPINAGQRVEYSSLPERETGFVVVLSGELLSWRRRHGHEAAWPSRVAKGDVAVCVGAEPWVQLFAVTDAVLVELPRGLGSALEDLGQRRKRWHSVADAFLSRRDLHGLSPTQMLGVLDLARLEECLGQPADPGLYLVVQGQVQLGDRGWHETGHTFWVDDYARLQPSLRALGGGMDRKAWVLRVPLAELRGLAHRDTGFARRLADPDLPQALAHELRFVAAASVLLVVVERAPGLESLDLAQVATQLAQGAARYGDSVATIKVGRTDDAAFLAQARAARQGLSRGAVNLRSPATRPRAGRWAADHVNWWCLGESDRLDLVLLDVTDAEDAFVESLAPAVDLCVRFCRHPYEAGRAAACFGTTVLPVVVLDHQARPLADTPRDVPRVPLRVPLRSVAVRQISASSPVLRQSCADRVARAMTDRLIGVAIGGGGSLAMAAVPLLRRLAAVEEPEQAPVPVDVVASVSGGSVVAAYYTQWAPDEVDREHAPLERFRKHWAVPLFGLSTEIFGASQGLWLAAISSRSMEWWYDRRLGKREIEQLPVRFLPVATSATDFLPCVPTRASVGYGVRASGALPGMFTAPVQGGVPLLDGLYARNVPAMMLQEAGVELVVACNPTIAFEQPRRSRRGGPALDPGTRYGYLQYRVRGAIRDLACRFQWLPVLPGMFNAFRGMQVLVSQASRASAGEATIVFEPPANNLTLGMTAIASRELERVAAAEVEAVVQRVRAAYRAMQTRPRWRSAPAQDPPDVREQRVAWARRRHAFVTQALAEVETGFLPPLTGRGGKVRVSWPVV